jgi:hypothetical protein
MRSVSRRALIGGIVTSTVGSAVLVSIPERTEASLSGELSVDDTTEEVQDPVSSAILNVSGTYEWDSDTTPGRIILRLKLTHTGTTEQLEATVIDSNLSPTGSREIDLSGNMMDHSELSAEDLTPDSNGDSATETATAVLSIELETDGTTLAQKELTDEFEVTVKQTVGSATVSVGATGSVDVQTSN